MTYELAKELKDAGFKHHWCYEMQNGIDAQSCKNPFWRCFPDLYELIEECGTAFISLDYSSGVMSQRSPENLTWLASGYKNGLVVSADGATPEEAVARLWLALNKNAK